MAPLVSELARLAEPWASLYADSTAAQTATTFAHFGGLLLGGGFAVATDHAVLTAPAGGEARRRVIDHVGRIHRPVLVGLAVTLASGVMLLAADVETYLVSVVFWTKMALVALLLANGALLQRAERTARRDDAVVGADGAEGEAAWRRVRGAAVASLVLWFVIVLVSTLLVNAA